MLPGAVIFDLDGVLTDTAEFHYLAWKRLADEEGLPFDREANEQLRGVARRESLLFILNGRSASEDQMEAMMARKNGYYQAMLGQISPDDLLPGVVDLLALLDEAQIPYGVASASKNAPEVVARLGIANGTSLVDGLTGNTVTVAGGIQMWTVPQTATYHIEVAGAQGGGPLGGKGAVLDDYKV